VPFAPPISRNDQRRLGIVEQLRRGYADPVRRLARVLWLVGASVVFAVTASIGLLGVLLATGVVGLASCPTPGEGDACHYGVRPSLLATSPLVLIGALGVTILTLTIAFTCNPISN
jgi:hypothetical protein